MSNATGLRALVEQALPLNRKERFYTGTVLPMIVCRDNFRYFGRFASLIPGCENLAIVGEPERTTIEFFTEYSFRESLSELSRRRFVDIPVTKETPDVVALISGSTPVLLAVEAKMYSATTAAKLRQQMRQQTPMLRCMAAGLGIDCVVHCCLVPQRLADRLGEFEFPVVAWEQVLSAFADFRDDYFVEVLRIALESYDDLAAVPTQWGTNCEQYESGARIYEDFKHGKCRWTMMGRKWGGLNGRPLMEDIASGAWRDWPYEVHSRKEPSTGNWFPIAAWVGLIDRALGKAT